MATVTLPVYTAANHWAPFGPSTLRKDFEIDQLSFTRSITRQGKGARAAWRQNFRYLTEIPQSHEVIEWNARRSELQVRSRSSFTGKPRPLHGFRAAHRALQDDPWAMIDKPSPSILHGDEQAAPGSDDF